ncbi:MAG: DNA/RNA non-specific endonuclease [Bacteroidaceae bacterium]|nr:DNA/RNA non-specific endonuclease [Bacteroidaceae bacterium]
MARFFSSQIDSTAGQTDVEQTSNAFEIPITNPGVPSKQLVRTGYAVSYNSNWRIPNWVAYELTAQEARGRLRREGSFEPDYDIGYNGADNGDYKGSGYSRGHMAPAGDMKWSGRAMRESFLLTNICPQDFDLNAGLWEDLESALRDCAHRWGSVYIVCGPVVDKGYETIGWHRVCVPQRFFKVVCWKSSGQWHCKAFVFPNRKLSGRFHDYSTSVDDVERLTGHDFFSKLPDNIENVIESRDNRGRW